MKKLTYTLLILLLAVFACSDFDEVQFTVLLPDAGQDIVFFTADSGTTINLDGSTSSDVNSLGFTYSWEVIEFPEGAPITLSGSDSAQPSFTVSENTSGRYILSLTIARGDQQARDFINVDVNPQIAEVLFVNGIDSNESASMSILSAQITGSSVAPLSTDNTYYAINIGQAADADGNLEIQVDFNGSTLSETINVQPLGNYVVYLVGTTANPELFVDVKAINNNTLPAGLTGLGAVNLAPDVSAMVLFIDGTAFNVGILPLDLVLQQNGSPTTIGELGFKQSGEVFFPTTGLLPLPIWATENEQRISNDSNISLSNAGVGQFGTFILFPDASSAEGYRLTFIANNALLPN